MSIHFGWDGSCFLYPLFLFPARNRKWKSGLIQKLQRIDLCHMFQELLYLAAAFIIQVFQNYDRIVISRIPRVIHCHLSNLDAA
mgnify:FL=1